MDPVDVSSVFKKTLTSPRDWADCKPMGSDNDRKEVANQFIRQSLYLQDVFAHEEENTLQCSAGTCWIPI